MARPALFPVAPELPPGHSTRPLLDRTGAQQPRLFSRVRRSLVLQPQLSFSWFNWAKLLAYTGPNPQELGASRLFGTAESQKGIRRSRALSATPASSPSLSCVAPVDTRHPAAPPSRGPCYWDIVHSSIGSPSQVPGLSQRTLDGHQATSLCTTTGLKRTLYHRA